MEEGGSDSYKIIDGTKSNYMVMLMLHTFAQIIFKVINISDECPGCC